MSDNLPPGISEWDVDNRFNAPFSSPEEEDDTYEDDYPDVGDEVEQLPEQGAND